MDFFQLHFEQQPLKILQPLGVISPKMFVVADICLPATQWESLS